MPKKETKVVPVTSTSYQVEEVKSIEKLEPFGNEDMHKLVAKINEIIQQINES
jgi:hypothetical protein